MGLFEKIFEFHMTDVYQGSNISPMINELEGLMKDGRKNISPRDHIDGVAALLDAMAARSHDYHIIGEQLKNMRN